MELLHHMQNTLQDSHNDSEKLAYKASTALKQGRTGILCVRERQGRLQQLTRPYAYWR